MNVHIAPLPSSTEHFGSGSRYLKCCAAGFARNPSLVKVPTQENCALISMSQFGWRRYLCVRQLCLLGSGLQMKPPSCSWQRMLAGGQPIYVNDITHQSMWTMPPALCWKVRNGRLAVTLLACRNIPRCCKLLLQPRPTSRGVCLGRPPRLMHETFTLHRLAQIKDH